VRGLRVARAAVAHVAPALQALCQEGGRLQRRLGGPTMLRMSEWSPSRVRVLRSLLRIGWEVVGRARPRWPMSTEGIWAMIQLRW